MSVNSKPRLSVGKFRHLTQCSSLEGAFNILAIDHRDNLVAEMQKQSGFKVDYSAVVSFKRNVIRHLSTAATAVLTDPDYGFPAIVDGALPGNIGLIAPLEVTNYTSHPSKRATILIPDWDVAKLKASGCSGAKLLLYFHPGAANADSQTEIVDSIVEKCQQHNVPFFLEPVGYSLDPAQPLSNIERRQVVVESARHFSTRGIDILKVEFPLDVAQEADENVWQAALEELDEACNVPWTLLSGGVSFETFLRQTELACAAGASGVMVGRAVWAEATALHREARDHFLSTVGVERMAQLAHVCKTGSPWMTRHIPPTIDEGWYKEAGT
ncbi:MAG: tagatose 1,6-diphosphate aldolase [Anaerolineae bacterium]|nr:tagatose 1,6-diphosphate aldolase [Anaerolineae bacterium]